MLYFTRICSTRRWDRSQNINGNDWYTILSNWTSSLFFCCEIVVIESITIVVEFKSTIQRWQSYSRFRIFQTKRFHVSLKIQHIWIVLFLNPSNLVLFFILKNLQEIQFFPSFSQDKNHKFQLKYDVFKELGNRAKI